VNEKVSSQVLHMIISSNTGRFLANNTERSAPEGMRYCRLSNAMGDQGEVHMGPSPVCKRSRCVKRQFFCRFFCRHFIYCKISPV